MSAVPSRVTRFASPSTVVAVALVAGMASLAVPGIAQEPARIDPFLQSYVDSNRIGGAVVLVVRDRRVVYERGVGWADREAKRPMTADAIFRIASESKPITSVAILQLAEAGKLSIDDPVSRWLPTFAQTFVASDAPGDSGRTLVPARRPITIRDLITHTAGISYGLEAQVASRYAAKALGPGAGAGLGWYTADKDAGLLSTARDYSRFLEMIRAGGTLDGVRILSSRSVDLMTHNQIGARYGIPGQGFGFGFYTIDSTGADGPKSVGTFGWRGGYGTIAFVDPKEKLTVVFMINQIPNTADLAARLPAVVYDAVVPR
jgi:CubicO group peptidase (beta-lactamase class C family)